MKSQGQLRLKADVLMARNRAILRALPASREAALTLLARMMVGTIAKVAPRDTNRYVRGWIEAGQGAGAKDTPLPPLQKSSRHSAILSSLMTQVYKNKRYLAIKTAELLAVQRKGKTNTKRGQRLVAQVSAATLRVEEATRRLKVFAGSETALAMLRKYSYVLNSNNRHISGKALNIEVKDTVYGGSGAIVHGTQRSVLRLHNLEPHSVPVERRSHTLGKAKAMVRGLGLKSLRKKYIEQLPQRKGK